jgi:hypothetical protein
MLFHKSRQTNVIARKTMYEKCKESVRQCPDLHSVTDSEMESAASIETQDRRDVKAVQIALGLFKGLKRISRLGSSRMTGRGPFCSIVSSAIPVTVLLCWLGAESSIAARIEQCLGHLTMWVYVQRKKAHRQQRPSGFLAQMVERPLRMREVGGSIPPGSKHGPAPVLPPNAPPFALFGFPPSFCLDVTSVRLLAAPFSFLQYAAGWSVPVPALDITRHYAACSTFCIFPYILHGGHVILLCCQCHG